MFPINWNDVFRKKDGTLGTMEDLEGGGSDLPEYDTGDAGKVLGVDNEGLLEWKELPGGTKIYYKDFNVTWGTNIQFAKFADNTPSASGYYAARPNGTVNVSISGYTPIASIAIDKYTGYYFGAFIEKTGNSHTVSFAISSRGIDVDSCGIRVYYAKNEDLAQLT